MQFSAKSKGSANVHANLNVNMMQLYARLVILRFSASARDDVVILMHVSDDSHFGTPNGKEGM